MVLIASLQIKAVFTKEANSNTCDMQLAFNTSKESF